MSPRAATAIAAATLAALTLSGCQEFRVPGVYRIDIQQGNVITQEQLAALEKGMEKRKVRFILGTPLVADTFNQNRWDYYYSIEKLGEARMQRIVSVFFEDDRLTRVGGDVLAALGPIEVESRKDEVVTVPDGYRDEGLLASLTPGFLSGKGKVEQPSAESAASDPNVTGTAAESPATQALQISTEDERYLRNLLVGFGRVTESQAAGSGASVQEQPTLEETRNEQAEEEGVLSRWARRLGLKADGDAAPPARPPVE